MCDDKPGSPIKLRKFCIEDMVYKNLKTPNAIADLVTVELENFDDRLQRKMLQHQEGSARDRLIKIKSKSDGDLNSHQSNDYKNSSRYQNYYKDFEVSSFPSDSDITVIRVLKRSRMRGIPSRAIENILGDGSHLPESPSMINLATLVELGIPDVSFTGEERLIQVSSWDSPINRTASDTKVIQSAINSIKINSCKWVDLRFSKKQESAAISTISNIDERFFPKNIVAGLSELMIVNNTRSLKLKDKDICHHINNSEIQRSSVVINADDNLLNEELRVTIGDNKSVISNNKVKFNIENINSKIAENSSARNDNIFVRFFTRIQKTFRRAIRCSCFPIVSIRERSKDKLKCRDEDML